MPIYEYECDACGSVHEVIQKMSDMPLRDCPACEKPELRKLISAAGFRLSGKGWYETDFKSGGKKRNLAEKDAGAPSSSQDKTASPTNSSPSSAKKSSSAS